MTVRVMCFTDRPDALLIFAPEGTVLPSLPRLQSPFVKESVASTLGAAGIDSRVGESVAGRWTQAMTTQRQNERSERFQRQSQATATEAALLRGSANTHVRDRADALARKLAVDERIRVLKETIVRASRDAARTGRYLPPQEFRALETELVQLKTDSQALQTRLGDMRKAEREQNRAHSDQVAWAFKHAAYKVLSKEQFEQLELAALDEIDDRAEADKAIACSSIESHG